MPSLKHVSADVSADVIVEALKTDGALIIDNLLDDATVAKIRGELDPYVDATSLGKDAFAGFNTTRTGALIARSAGCRDLAMHPTVLAACDRFLLPNCERYQINVTQVIRLRSGQPSQPMHRDKFVWNGLLAGIEPQLNTHWAITDFTLANGATQVAPGSQTWPDEREADPSEITYAEMKRGSVLVYTGSVLHAGGENRTEDDRIGLNLTYSLGWLRQEENQYLSCPPSIARTLDPKLQALLGYTMGNYALGYFSPPLPPGVGPETVPPELAVGDEGADWKTLFESFAERQKGLSNAA